jgi:hypothetical protein
MWKTQKAGGAKLFRACVKCKPFESKLAPVGEMIAYTFLGIALVGLTYLNVLFNFTSLYRSFVQTALGVAQWESQPTAHVTLGGSKRTVSVRVWKRNGDAQRLLAAARRDASS